MKYSFYSILSVLLGGLVLMGCSPSSSSERTHTPFVDKFIGTGGNARVAPVASVPFGMMQLCADTRDSGSGYHYDDPAILGFSHLHKSGGGCADFLDILFMPLPTDVSADSLQTLMSHEFISPLDHRREKCEPGLYTVDLYDGAITADLTATSRCGIQRYRYRDGHVSPLVIDLEHGSTCACTILPEHDVDTVYAAYLEVVDSVTVRGYRKSNGWVTGQEVYFYSRFSSPIRSASIYSCDQRLPESRSAEGRRLKLLLTFDDSDPEIVVSTAISSVDMDGAKQNLLAEATADFDVLSKSASDAWESQLSLIDIETSDSLKKKLFYTSLHNVMLYPMLFSDQDHRFRAPDGHARLVNDFNYYGAVIGLWDTFRAACPLLAVLRPDVMRDYVCTMLAHYRYFGQLPIWTLWGKETFQMIGVHAMPVITNCYLNGITDFDTRLAREAMVNSAMKDTCGYSMGYFVGFVNYMNYDYVPCDKEMEATARTLEYAYDDAAIARFVELTGGDVGTRDYFLNRSKNYRNVIDSITGLARGRCSDGSWRTPFHPLRSNHRKDDYCEGNAWQWTFFVPHDVEGLATLLGGKDVLEARLDTLFTMRSGVDGENASGDISGFIGQYAHGNEPSHHTIYMYNHLGAAAKTQRYVHQVMNTLYANTPEGICGNEDTGQMSAWYVFSALGFYPMDPVSGRYELGTPSFDKAVIHLPSGKDFTVRAVGLTPETYLVKRVELNGKQLDRSYITFDELNAGGELVFHMSPSTK